VLSSIVADYLFKKFPYKEEGFLTEMRSRIVSRSQLNKLSIKLGLDNLVKSELFRSYSKSLHGDAFEAFVGALYLDKGYNYTKKIILKISWAYLIITVIAIIVIRIILENGIRFS